MRAVPIYHLSQSAQWQGVKSTKIRAAWSSKRGAVTPRVQKCATQNYVASLLKMEQEGLDDTANFLGLLHKLFLSYSALFLSKE